MLFVMSFRNKIATDSFLLIVWMVVPPGLGGQLWMEFSSRDLNCSHLTFALRSTKLSTGPCFKIATEVRGFLV